MTRLRPLDGTGEGIPDQARRGDHDHPAPTGRRLLPCLPELRGRARPRSRGVGRGLSRPRDPRLPNQPAVLVKGRPGRDPGRVPPDALPGALLQPQDRPGLGGRAEPAGRGRGAGLLRRARSGRALPRTLHDGRRYGEALARRHLALAGGRLTRPARDRLDRYAAGRRPWVPSFYF